MKQIILSLFVFVCTGHSKAQDIITKTDSTKIRAEVLEITPTQLKYKLFDYPGGPLITENKSQIAYVTFKNGLTERFPKAAPVVPRYDPNAYNLDHTSVAVYAPEARIKKRDALYAHKNYIGFNYIAFLNTALGFHYMRDVKKAHLILNVPVAFGVGSPSITNGLYGRNYLDGTGTTRYQRMNYQLGVSALFAPAMNTSVNFLMGPSFNFTEYRMNVASIWNVHTSSQSQKVEFKNNFKLYRAHYGINVGFLARYTEHFNMSILLTLGFKQDSYSEQDPYGFEIMRSLYKDAVTQTENTKPYVNFAWTVGYRF
jgi:hypothetical protein